MEGCVRLTVRKQSGAFRLQLGEGLLRGSSISIVFVVDDSVESINSDLIEILQENQVPLNLKTAKHTASMRVDTNLSDSEFCVEELLQSKQKSAISSLVCAVCRIEANDFQQLNIHYREHLIDGPLRCSFCEGTISFQTLATFKEHLQSHREAAKDSSEQARHTDDNTAQQKRFAVECEVCHKKFPTLKGLGAHRRTHKAQPENGDLLKQQCAEGQYRQSRPSDKKDNGSHSTPIQQSERPATVRELLACSKGQSGSKPTAMKSPLLNCSICKASFSLQAKLDSHILQVHHEQLRDRCPQCDKVHLSTSQLRSHILERHSVHFTFVTKGNSKSSRNAQISCNYCPEVYHDPVELLVHCKTIHVEQLRSLDCPHCGKQFSTEKRFANHVSSKGNECSRRPSCSVCFRGFSSQKALSDHMRSIHPQNGQINRLCLCTECNEGYATKAALRYHIKAKHGSERFPCTFCDKTFALPVQKHRHETRVHQRNRKQHACNICTMTFVTTRELLQHLLNGHKVIPDVNELGEAILPDGTLGPVMKHYVCQHCSHITYSRKTFIRHQATHTGVWPFVCDVCGKGFSERFQALKHVRVQHSEASNDGVQDEGTFPGVTQRSPIEQSVCEKTGSQSKTHTINLPSTSNNPKINGGYKCHFTLNYNKNATKNEKFRSQTPFVDCNVPSLESFLASSGVFAERRANLRHPLKISNHSRYPCRRCRAHFHGPAALIMHRYRLCQTPRRQVLHSCPLCHTQIISGTGFRVHLKIHRYVELKAFSCLRCSAKFSFESSLSAHVRQRHHDSGHSFFSCSGCNRGFVSKWSLKRHQKIHSQHGGHRINFIEAKESILDLAGTAAIANSDDHLVKMVEITAAGPTNIEETMISPVELLNGISQMDQQGIQDIASVTDVVTFID